MTDIALLICAILTSCVASSLFALSQQKHWNDVIGKNVRRSVSVRFIRRLAWVFVAMSAALIVLRDGPSFGVILWPLVLFASAVGVVAGFAYRPGFLAPIARKLAEPEAAEQNDVP